MESNFLYTLVFAGIIQGLFLSIFILSSKKNKSKASTYLGLLILTLTLTNLQFTLDELSIITWHQFNLIYLPYLFLLAPFLYFFILTFLYPERKPKKRELLLYIPTIFFLGVSIVYKLTVLITGKTTNNDSSQVELADLVDVYGDFVNIPIILITIISLFIIINTYSKTTDQLKTRVEVNELLWIKVFLIFMLLSLIPWFIYTYKYWQDENIVYLPIFLLTSFIIYAFGYIGIHKIKILNQRKKIRSFLNKNRDYTTTEKSKNEHITRLEKIVIQDQGYLNPNLTLDSLTEALQLSKSHLSRIINSELQMSFSDYINSLRVSEAKKLLINPEFSNYTLVSIGLESGFSSKTTFNTTFKKITNQTPSQFRKNPSN